MINIPFSLKIIAKPLLILVLLISVSLIGFKSAFYEIGGLREELETAHKNENILKSKLETLSANRESVSTDANYAVSFLPGENPGLLVLYQLRSNAANNGLFLSNLKVGSETKDPNGFMKISISFDLQGSMQQILNFVNSTKVTSPNIWVEKTELDFMGDISQASASINAKSYWSAFPTKIPALTEPITSLNSSEKETLSKISGFTLPPFESLTAGAPRENPNPFGE